MSIRVLHLNDAGIRVSGRGSSESGDTRSGLEYGTHYSSPGYALIDPPRIEFGVGACAQSRLYPLNTYHQFWHRLDMEPFSRPVAHFRHNADIAFSHLKEVASDTELDGDVIMLVPGSFSRQQLAVLLGLARQCPFRVRALVDSGVAAGSTIGEIPAEGLIHIELQLHQVVLTRLRQQDDEILRDTVAVVPAAGRVQMMESVLQLMTSAFVQQCRFNPQHNARSEQFLFDCLPEWLDGEVLRKGGQEAGEESDSHAGLISLQHHDTVHRARILPDSVRSRLAPYYMKITQQLATLDPGHRCPLVLAPALARLPGFNEHFRDAPDQAPRDIRIVTVEAAADSCLAHGEQLLGNTESVRFHTRLPRAHGATVAAASPRENPSHLLAGHHASRLQDRMVVKLGDVQAEIIFDAGHYFLRSAATGVRINGIAAEDSQRLQLGDSISASGSDQHLQLIRVEDGQH